MNMLKWFDLRRGVFFGISLCLFADDGADSNGGYGDGEGYGGMGYSESPSSPSDTSYGDAPSAWGGVNDATLSGDMSGLDGSSAYGDAPSAWGGVNEATLSDTFSSALGFGEFTSAFDMSSLSQNNQSMAAALGVSLANQQNAVASLFGEKAAEDDVAGRAINATINQAFDFGVPAMSLNPAAYSALTPDQMQSVLNNYAEQGRAVTNNGPAVSASMQSLFNDSLEFGQRAEAMLESARTPFEAIGAPISSLAVGPVSAGLINGAQTVASIASPAFGMGRFGLDTVPSAINNPTPTNVGNALAGAIGIGGRVAGLDSLATGIAQAGARGVAGDTRGAVSTIGGLTGGLIGGAVAGQIGASIGGRAGSMAAGNLAGLSGNQAATTTAANTVGSASDSFDSIAGGLTAAIMSAVPSASTITTTTDDGISRFNVGSMKAFSF